MRPSSPPPSSSLDLLNLSVYQAISPPNQRQFSRQEQRRIETFTQTWIPSPKTNKIKPICNSEWIPPVSVDKRRHLSSQNHNFSLTAKSCPFIHPSLVCSFGLCFIQFGYGFTSFADFSEECSTTWVLSGCGDR